MKPIVYTDMKKFLTFVSSGAVLIILADFLFGFSISHYIENYGLHGDYQPIEHVMKTCEDDVLAIGSSVVLNSFVPTVFEDSLGLTCYNAGANSQTMPFFHTILNSVLQRYTPKMILLGLRPNELSGNDIGRYHLLIPYYRRGINEIDSVLESKNKYEKYLLKSNLYRYNTVWFRIMLYHFIRDHEKGIKGFSGHKKPLFPPQLTTSTEKSGVSVMKMKLFKDFVCQCEKRGIALVVYFPPMYTLYEEKTATVTEVQRLCQEHHIPCYYDTQDSIFLKHQEWFYDNVHLVKDASYIYSKSLVKRVKRDLCVRF